MIGTPTAGGLAFERLGTRWKPVVQQQQQRQIANGPIVIWLIAVRRPQSDGPLAGVIASRRRKSIP